MARKIWTVAAAGTLVATAAAFSYPWPAWVHSAVFSASYYPNATLVTLAAFNPQGGGGGGGTGACAQPLAGLTQGPSGLFGTTGNAACAFALLPQSGGTSYRTDVLAPLATGTNTTLAQIGPATLAGTEAADAYVLTVNGASVTKTIIYSFTGGPGGTAATSGLTPGAAGALYGVASGGVSGRGLVYRLTPDAGGKYTQTVLFNFTKTYQGALPASEVVLDTSGRIYGSAAYGGQAQCAYGTLPPAKGCGVVYRLDPPAVGQKTWTQTVLHTFLGGVDGAGPGGLALQANGNLFGATVAGGPSGFGTVFGLFDYANGVYYNYNVLWLFTDGADGRAPNTRLAIDSNGALYGAAQGGTHGDGTAFIVVPPPIAAMPWTFSTIYSFAGPDGATPVGGPVIDTAGNLFGVTSAGGQHGGGTAYELVP